MIKRIASAAAKVAFTAFGLLYGVVVAGDLNPVPKSPTYNYVCRDMTDQSTCWIDSITGEDGVTRKMVRP